MQHVLSANEKKVHGIQHPNKRKVLSTEVNTFKRRIKEAIQIKLTKPALNRDNGYELAAIYDTILTPKRR